MTNATNKPLCFDTYGLEDPDAVGDELRNIYDLIEEINTKNLSKKRRMELSDELYDAMDGLRTAVEDYCIELEDLRTALRGESEDDE